MGRGGARAGAGRKRKGLAAEWLAGYPSTHGGKSRERPASVANGPVVEVNCPEECVGADKAVWNEMAPLALAERTLTPATAQAFADLCAYVVLERRMRLAPLAVGGADHRGMMARIEAARARFRLTADGKPVMVEEKKDEWQEFDGPQLVHSA